MIIMNNKIDRLLEYIVKGETITLDLLKKCGFRDEDIEYLIESGYLGYRNDVYYLKDVNDLLYLGVCYASKRVDGVAIMIFEKCLEFCPSNVEARKRLITRYLFLGEYRKAKSEFAVLKSYDESMTLNDYRLGLMIFDYILNTRQCDFSIEDIAFDGVPNTDLFVSNQVMRTNVLQMRFPTALAAANDIYFDEVFDVADKTYYNIFKTLLSSATTIYYENRRKINNFLSEGKFNEARVFLKAYAVNGNVSRKDSYLLLLLERLNDIKCGKEVKVNSKGTYKNVFDAILSNDFYEARRINNAHFYMDNGDGIGLVLNEIISLIESKEQDKPIYKEIKVRLTKANKREFIPYLFDLAKVSEAEFDRDYSKVKFALGLIEAGAESFSLNGYIDKFYECLGSKDINKANLYKNVIVSLAPALGKDIDSLALNQALSTVTLRKPEEFTV